MRPILPAAVLPALVMSLLFASPQSAVADPELQALKKQLELLQQKVTELEHKQAKAEAQETKSAQDDLDALTTDTSATSQPVTAQASAIEPLLKENVGGRYQNNVISNTTIGGYASIEFEDFQNNNSTFDQHRFVLNVGSQVTDRIKFYSEVEFEHGATFEYEGSAEGDITIADTNGNGQIDADEARNIPVELETNHGRSGEFALEQVWMQYDVNEHLAVRAGIILVPFGKFNLVHDDDLQVLTDRPLVARRVIPTTWAESGAGFVMKLPIGEESTLYGELYALNGLNDGISSGGGAFRDARGSYEDDNNNNKAIVGRLALSPLIGQEVGLSGYTGNYDANGNGINAGAFDWDLRAVGFRFLGEAAYFGIDRAINSSGDVVPGNIWGGYAELSYPFWIAALNETFLGHRFADPKLIPVVRYNYAEIDRRDEAANLDEESIVVGLAYRPV
ncbi:MAG: hypothetical protein IT290_00740, partial [Deltaproteobacteria bacterium]|nr:hypothetical protein [Deltaproteobacteria bacterium]